MLLARLAQTIVSLYAYRVDIRRMYSISPVSSASYGHLVRIRNFDLSGSYLEAAVPDSDQIGKFRHIIDSGKIN